MILLDTLSRDVLRMARLESLVSSEGVQRILPQIGCKGVLCELLRKSVQK